MFIEREKTFGEFVDWVCSYTDEELVNQIHIVDEMLDNDVVLESVFADYVLDMRELMRDEIVRRADERLKRGKSAFVQE